MALDVEESLYALIARYFLKPIEAIDENTRFKKDLKADSLDFLEFVLLTEEHFRCPLDDDALSEVVTVGQFSRLLQDSIGLKPAQKENDETII